jgi:plastocyanin
VVTVRLVDNAFQPAAISLTLGKDYIFVLDSDGNNPHTYTIARNTDRTGAVAGLEVDVQLQAQETKVVQVLVPREAGKFSFYCRIHGSSGMVGTVQVAAGQSTTSTPAPASTPVPPPPTPTPGPGYY